MDATIWNLCHWRSTIDTVIDVELSGDDRAGSALLSSPLPLLGQINEIAAKIQARAAFDQYGRMFVKVDPQNTPVALRAAIPVVQVIGEEDWHERVGIGRAADEAVQPAGGLGHQRVEGVLLALPGQDHGALRRGRTRARTCCAATRMS